MEFAVKQEVTPCCKGIPIPESRKFWLVESGILDFGIRNTAQGIRGIPLTIEIRNPTSKKKSLESSTWNLESTAWKPESRILRLSYIPLYGAKEVMTG